MVEWYASWTKGLPQSEEALRILAKNNLGIEMSNIDNQVEMVKKAEVKVSAHTPGLNLTLNLAKPDFMRVFEENGGKGTRLLEVIRSSDAPVVGFHLGYSAESVYKMMAFPNTPALDSIIENRAFLLKRIADNVTGLERLINSTLIRQESKRIVLETLDYSRERKIPWELQREEARLHREEIQGVVKQYGINAGLLHVTEPDFVKKLLKNTEQLKPTVPIGFLFDVAHNFISADAKSQANLFVGTTNEYFERMLHVTNGKIYQLHLTVPAGDRETGYSDRHRQFTPGDKLSDRIMGLAKAVYKSAPEIQVITLEIKEPELLPIEHARRMVQQKEYVARELSLS